MRELIVDSFAGGGGASTGIMWALGRSPDIAINHDAEAIAMHRANHPETFHLITNVWKVDPYAVAQGRKVGLLWASPDCKHFSKAKGGKPVNKNIRDLGWVVYAWAKTVRPRVIFLENVQEWADWGPLDEDDMPCKQRKGQTFKRFVTCLRNKGYKVEWRRQIVAADHGSPTTRTRLYLLARCDGLPIVWPTATFGRRDGFTKIRGGDLKEWRSAAECIDWSRPVYSIFITKAEAKAIYKATGVRLQRPLAKNTMARIARGVKRYVLDAEKPFLVPVTHTGDQRVHSAEDPLRTTTCAQRGEQALIQPFLTKFNGGATGSDAKDPVPTVMSMHSDTHPGGAPHLGVVAPLIVKNYHGDRPDSSMAEPLKTVLTGQHHMLVAPLLAGVGSRAGQSPERSLERPGPTTTATKRGQHALVAAGVIRTDMQSAAARNGVRDAEDPSATITTGGGLAVVAAGMVRVAHGERDANGKKRGRGEHDTAVPLPTQPASPEFAMVAAGLVNTRNGEREGQEPRVRDLGEPAPTTTAKGSQGGVVVAHLCAHYGPGEGGQNRAASAEEPLRTATCEPRHSAVVAHLVRDFGGSTGAPAGEPAPVVMPGGGGKIGIAAVHIAQHNSERGDRVKAGRPATLPASTITSTGGQQGIVAAYLAQHNTDMVGHEAAEPLSTIVQKGCTQAVVAANLISLKGSDRRDGSAEAPAPAQCAGGTHTGVVAAALTRYFGTEQNPEMGEPVGAQTTRDRSGMIEVPLGLPPLTTEQYERAKMVAKFLRKFGCWSGGELVTTRDGSVVVDIGMRMLIPRELFRAQGFLDSYVIDHGITETGEIVKLTKTALVRLVGNSVCPQVAEALVRANYHEMDVADHGVPEFALTAAE